MGLVVEQIKRAKDDLLYFLDHFVYTLDEHDSVHPVKPMPMEKEYLRELASLFLSEKLLLVEKSRQMMATWLFVACCLWDAQFHEGRRIFLQSKKEVDADGLIQRAKHIYNNYPEPYKGLIHAQYPAREPMAYLKLEFAKNQSILQGTPQGPDMLRQYTASLVFMDEAAFQPQLEQAIIASRPTTVGGGKLILCSTPNFKNTFYQLRSDLI